MRRDLTRRETLVVAPMILLIIFFGLYPKPLTDVVNPAVEATLVDVGATDPAPAAPEARP
jgi:NADH-quinone oxidoreductase subunit M